MSIKAKVFANSWNKLKHTGGSDNNCTKLRILVYLYIWDLNNDADDDDDDDDDDI